MPTQPNLFDDSPKPERDEVLQQKIQAIPISKDLPDSGLLDLVPDDATLELTRQFNIQSIHIGKTLNFLSKIELQNTKISLIEIASEFAYSKRHMEGIYNVIRELGLIDSSKKVTPFGKIVGIYCPYIDDKGLLWLFHYLLGSNASLVIWSYLFNSAIRNDEEFSVKTISQGLILLSKRWSERSVNVKAPGEANSILKYYSDGFLKPIDFIERNENKNYELISGNSSIPPLIWLSSLLIYRDRYYPEAPSLEVPLIIDANYCPGRIFRQNISSVRKTLDVCHNMGLLSVETRSGLDQIRFKHDVTWLSAAAQYLRGESS